MEWINVNDRLPSITIDEKKDINDSEKCIIILKNGEVYKGYLSHWYESPPDEFNWVFSDSNEICESVTHWMPLPEPPKP